MKKILLFACVGIITVSGMTSCKKTYVCECLDSRGKERTETVLATTPNSAQKKCDEFGLPGHCEIQ